MPGRDEKLSKANPRTEFLLKNGRELRQNGNVPLCLGIMAAPLYDHRSGLQIALVVAGIGVANWAWIRLWRPWMERRMGVFRLRGFGPPTLLPEARAMSAAMMKQSVRKLKILFVVVVVPAMVYFFVFDPHASAYQPRGRIERLAGTLSVMMLVTMVEVATNSGNPGARRVGYGVASLVLLVAFGFIGSTSWSFAMLLVVLGGVMLAVSMLDVGLMLRLAPTTMEDAHA